MPSGVCAWFALTIEVMGGFLRRYEAGDCERVWSELCALEPPSDAARLEEADAVVCLAMDRVRTNLELLHGRLQDLGFRFGLYPDGTAVPGFDQALYNDMGPQRRLVEKLEQTLGPLPLSLRCFGEIAGSVNFIGCHGQLNGMLDPLVVEFYEEQLDEYAQWKEDALENGEDEVEPFILPLSPDDLHKDNVSGASPCGMVVPATAVDAIWEPSGLLFMDYLRDVILRGGGFAGHREATPEARHLIGRLTQGLQPF